MGSVSDYEVMADAVAMLGQFGVDFEKRVVSAHRTPDLLCEYAKTAKNRGIGVIIAGAGGAAHLPGMVASMTTLPVVGVPVKSRALNGLDSLLSIHQFHQYQSLQMHLLIYQSSGSAAVLHYPDSLHP